MIPDINQINPEDLIVYADDFIIAVNKPAGMLTVPGGYSPDSPDLRAVLEPAWGPLWIVHRLDKDTSGLVLLARSAESHRQLNLQFDQRLISKEYRAIVYGSPKWNSFHLEQPLKVDGDRSHRTICSSQGKTACTDFEVLHRFPCFSYLAIFPHTGLTHQIRAHLAYLSIPIIQDELYGNKYILQDDINLIARMALHAIQIQFTHPHTQELSILSAPLAGDIRLALDRLPQTQTHEATDYNAMYNTVAYQVSSKYKKNTRI